MLNQSDVDTLPSQLLSGVHESPDATEQLQGEVDDSVESDSPQASLF
jgi:hypothetical protein